MELTRRTISATESGNKNKNKIVNLQRFRAPAEWECGSTTYSSNFDGTKT